MKVICYANDKCKKENIILLLGVEICILNHLGLSESIKKRNRDVQSEGTFTANYMDTITNRLIRRE